MQDAINEIGNGHVNNIYDSAAQSKVLLISSSGQ